MHSTITLRTNRIGKKSSFEISNVVEPALIEMVTSYGFGM